LKQRGLTHIDFTECELIYVRVISGSLRRKGVNLIERRAIFVTYTLKWA
jgi:hypothetical protein